MDRGKIATISFLVAAAAATRLLPHPPNFVPLAALGTFAAVYAPSRLVACAIVLSSMLLSDLALGLHSTLPFVYGALVLNVFLSAAFIRARSESVSDELPAAGSIAGVTLLNSLLFFFITNFGVWAVQSLYPKTAAGLALCYTAALPFLKYSLAADLFYGALLFSSYLAIRKLSPTAGEEI